MADDELQHDLQEIDAYLDHEDYDPDYDHMAGFIIPPEHREELKRQCFAEMMGTFILVFFGCGCLACAVLTGSLNSLWQVVFFWGMAASLGIFSCASVSGGHINPAVTIAIWFNGDGKEFPLYRVLPYIGAQTLGAFIAGWAVYGSFIAAITRYDTNHNDWRSTRTAMIFGMYFPNPAQVEFQSGDVTMLNALFIEAFGTAILMFFILVLTDKNNSARPAPTFIPYFIGYTIANLMMLYAPLTQGGYNPARDFGPRLVAALMGWGDIAIPGPKFGFWVYTFGPIIGACFGGWVYKFLAGDHFKYVSNLSGEAFQIEEGLEEEKIDTEFLTEKREHHATKETVEGKKYASVGSDDDDDGGATRFEMDLSV